MIPRLLQRAVRNKALHRVPEALKAPLRAVVKPEHIYDAGLLRLGLDHVNPDDVFLCSFPRSGNTWLRFLIARLQHPEMLITFRNINAYLPELGNTPLDLNAMEHRPVMKTHWPLMRKFPRAIYICRDPRDAMVSFFHYRTGRGSFRGSLPEFVRERPYCGPWDEHVEEAWNERERRPNDILLIRYEDLIAAPHEIARSVAVFLGLCVADDRIDKAVQATSFDQLRKNEHTFGGERHEGDRGFFRKGVVGGWSNELAADDAAYICDRFAQTMARMGYERHA